MAKVNLLKAKMVEAGSRNPYRTLAEVLGISMTSARNKLNDKSYFVDWEIKRFSEVYNLKAEEIKNLFL